MRTGNKLLDATKDRHNFDKLILPLFNSNIIESPVLLCVWLGFRVFLSLLLSFDHLTQTMQLMNCCIWLLEMYPLCHHSPKSASLFVTHWALKLQNILILVLCSCHAWMRQIKVSYSPPPSLDGVRAWCFTRDLYGGSDVYHFVIL